MGAVNGRNGLNSSVSVQIGRHVTPDHEEKVTAFEQNLFVQRSHACTRPFPRTTAPLRSSTLRRNRALNRRRHLETPEAPVRKSKANAREGNQTAVNDRTCPNDGRLRSFYVTLYDRSLFRRFRRRRAPCASFPSGLTPWRLSLWRPLAPGAFRLSLAAFRLSLAAFRLSLAVFCLGLASLSPRRFR